MGRPSHTKEWFPNNNITIHLKEKDEIHTYTTPVNSYIYTNKRAWDHLQATVIQGKHEVKASKLNIKAGTRIWSCQIYGHGIISSIGLPNEEVTVIIHIK